MFFHSFKYGILMSIRNKSQIFWSLLFTIILGTLFYSTFGNAYDMELNKSVKVACYFENEEIKNAFDMSVADAALNDDGDKLLDITYADNWAAAEELLLDGDVAGILYSQDDSLKLMVKDNGISESVLGVVVERFHQNSTIIKEAAMMGDEGLVGSIVALLGSDGSNNKERKLTDASMNPFLIYFYNLIAMSCLFSSFAVLDITSRNQGNLSAVGARKCVAKRSVVVSQVAELLAHVVVMFALSFASFLYLMMIGVDFGDKIGAITITILMGNIMGTAFGFFVGSFNLSAGIKDGLTVGISLIFCFFSGLMVADMRPLIEDKFPLFNDINPAAMICDSLYALNVYEGYDRLITNLASMMIVSVIFIAGGMLVGRRKSYASL